MCENGRKCNNSVNNEFKIMRKNNSLYQVMNESEQIMKQAVCVHVCLIIFPVHYFDIMNSQ